MPLTPPSLDELLHRTGPLQVLLLLLLSAALLVALVDVARRARRGPAARAVAPPRGEDLATLVPAQRSRTVDAPADR